MLIILIMIYKEGFNGKALSLYKEKWIYNVLIWFINPYYQRDS